MVSDALGDLIQEGWKSCHVSGGPTQGSKAGAFVFVSGAPIQMKVSGRKASGREACLHHSKLIAPSQRDAHAHVLGLYYYAE